MLTFDLATLHTQDARPGAPAPGWTKLTNALIVVFDTFRSGGEPTVTMKILQASHVLFDVPLQKLIDRGKPVVERLYRDGIDVSSEAAQLPISGMASNPALAIRYNMPEVNKVRRIQLKFAKSEDFDVAYDHVRELGLWFTPTQKSRLSTPASTQGVGPSCPPSQLSEITGRPGTAVSSASTGLPTSLNDARPSTTSFFDSGSTASSRRPESAASLSPDNTMRVPLSARLDSTVFVPSELPPRRELPFERLDTPGSAGSNSTRSASRPLSGIMGPPVLPASALGGNKRPTSRSGSSHGIELPALRKPTYINKSFISPMTKPNTSPTSTFAAREASRPHSAFAHNDYTALQQALSSAPVLTPSPPRPASSYSSATTHPLSIVTSSHDQVDTAMNPATPPASDVNMSSSSPVANEDSRNHAEDLAAYSQQPDDNRLGYLNKFIFDHLEDDNFLTLVTDMQMAWARIGTGME